MTESGLRNRLWIDNAWEDAASGETFPDVDPATLEVLADVASADRDDVARAAASAKRALHDPSWRDLSPHQRSRLLWKLSDLIEEHADELATLETRDNGKPYFESRKVDLPSVVENFRYFAGLADKVEGTTIPVAGPFLNFTLREPVGVVGCIIPWNFPLPQAAWKVAPALACGNTVVLKPAEQTPLTALRLAELAAEAGFPPGVFNVVPGMGETAGAAVVTCSDIDAVAFTGSTEVGKKVMRAAADSVKKVSLELGGKSPNIVFADADIAAAVRGASTGIFYGKGEVCAAGSRVLVEESVYESFVEALASRAAKMTVGDPMDPGTRLGAIVNERQTERVMHYVDRGNAEGARLVAGGERVQVGPSTNFVTATVFADVDPDMTIAREEIFGPVVSVLPFRDVEDAVALGNDTIYGLAAGVWTRDVGKAHRMAKELEAGTVWVNTYNRYASGSPFGGYKQSGFGRDLGWASAIEKYTQVKSVWMAVDR